MRRYKKKVRLVLVLLISLLLIGAGIEIYKLKRPIEKQKIIKKNIGEIITSNPDYEDTCFVLFPQWCKNVAEVLNIPNNESMCIILLHKINITNITNIYCWFDFLGYNYDKKMCDFIVDFRTINNTIGINKSVEAIKDLLVRYNLCDNITVEFSVKLYTPKIYEGIIHCYVKPKTE